MYNSNHVTIYKYIIRLYTSNCVIYQIHFNLNNQLKHTFLLFCLHFFSFIFISWRLITYRSVLFVLLVSHFTSIWSLLHENS